VCDVDADDGDDDVEKQSSLKTQNRDVMMRCKSKQ
jgi:hypothetical protein